jgi:hypothetical protein
MDKQNSIVNKQFVENQVYRGISTKTAPNQNLLKINHTGASGDLSVYQSGSGLNWIEEVIDTISGAGSLQVSLTHNYYFIEYTHTDSEPGVVSIISTPYVGTDVQLTQDDVVTVSGLTFDNDGKLLVSGNGGGGGGDASAANQSTQINIATNSNLAICSRLDLIDTNTNNIEVILDNYQFTSGNLMVRDTQLNTTLNNSNLAQFGKLNLIAETNEDLLISVDGISAKLNPLQIQSAKYTIEAVSQFAPDTVPQYTAPPAGIPKDEGWYFKNLENGQVSQLYFYSYLNPAMSVAGRQFAYTLADITMSYCVVKLIAVNSAEGITTLGIYTRPTGSGDAVPGFFKSRKVYNIPSTAKLTQGMEVMLYWGVEPNLKLHPGVARIQLQLASTVGPAVGTEELAFLSINTDSAALAGNSEYVVSAAGFQYAAELIMNNEFTGESSEQVVGGDASAANQISSNTAICARLDSSNVVLSAIQEILGDSVNVINYGLLNDTPEYIPIRASSTGNLHVYDSQTHSELLTLNAEIDGVIDDTAGALKVVGDFYQASQPVQFESPQDVNLYAGAALTHTQTGENQNSLDVNVNNSSIAVTGTFFQETQPVSISELAFTAQDELIVYDNSAVLKLTDIDTKLEGIETQTDLLSFVPQLTYNSLRVNVDNEYGVNIVTMPAITIAESQTIGLVENTVVGLAPNSTIGVSGEVSLAFGTQVGIDPSANGVTVSNEFATESTADAIKTQTDKLTFLDIDENTNNLKVIDVALNTTLGQLAFITGDDAITDLRVRVMNTNIDIGNFPETQPVSIADPVDTHLYGLNNETWNAITSTAVSGTETYTALDVKCRGDTSIINTDSTAIYIRPRDSLDFQVATNASVAGPIQIGNLQADTQGYTYISAIMSFSNVSSGGNVFIEVSHDGNLWARPSGGSTNVLTSMANVTASILLSSAVPFRYARLFADTGFIGSGCNAWIVMK